MYVFFYQMFTLLTVQNMFKIINEKWNELVLIYMPNLVVTNFKQAINNSIYEMFSLCKVIGRRFHLSQSWVSQNI